MEGVVEVAGEEETLVVSVVGAVFVLGVLLLADEEISSALRFDDGGAVLMPLAFEVGRGVGLVVFSDRGEGEGAASPVMPAMTEPMNFRRELLVVTATTELEGGSLHSS